MDVFSFLSCVSREDTVAGVSAAIADGLVTMLGAAEALVYVTGRDPTSLCLSAQKTMSADGTDRRRDEDEPARVYAEPLMAEDGLMGVLVIERAEPLTAAERDALAAAAGPLAAFVVRARREAERVVGTSICEPAPRSAPGEARSISGDIDEEISPLALYCQLIRAILKRGMPGALELLDDMERVIKCGVGAALPLGVLRRSASTVINQPT